jgi:hypothetical protein
MSRCPYPYPSSISSRRISDDEGSAYVLPLQACRLIYAEDDIAFIQVLATAVPVRLSMSSFSQKPVGCHTQPSTPSSQPPGLEHHIAHHHHAIVSHRSDLNHVGGLFSPQNLPGPDETRSIRMRGDADCPRDVSATEPEVTVAKYRLSTLVCRGGGAEGDVVR